MRGAVPHSQCMLSWRVGCQYGHIYLTHLLLQGFFPNKIVEHLWASTPLWTSRISGRYRVQFSVSCLATSRFSCVFSQYFCAGGGILNSDPPHRLCLASLGLYIHVVLFNILVLAERVWKLWNRNESFLDEWLNCLRRSVTWRTHLVSKIMGSYSFISMFNDLLSRQ
jgi:hypothetical protein